MASLERVWVIGADLYPLQDRFPNIEGIEVLFVPNSEKLLSAIPEQEKISFISEPREYEKTQAKLAQRIIASRIFTGERDPELLQLQVNALVKEIRLEHDLEIAEAVAWKGTGVGEGISLDLVGKAILEIFSCRNTQSIESALVSNGKSIVPVEKIILRSNPPYASIAELGAFQLAIPVQFNGKLLAHIYARFNEQNPVLREQMCETLGEFLLGISDAVALAIDRNSMLFHTEETGLVWEASFDAVEDPVVILNADFLVVRANRAYAQMVRIEQAALVGRESIIFRAEDLKPYLDYSSSEWEFTAGRNHYRVFMDKIIEPLGDGRIVLRLHDTTDEKLLRERLLAHNQVADLGILISSVAHEINNPIAGILLFAQMLLAEESATGQLRRDLTNIREAAERCKRIIQTMLSLVRRSDHRRTEVNLTDCLMDVLGLVAPEAKRLKVNIEVRNQLAGAKTIEASKNQILQALFHLIQQALLAIADTAKSEQKFKGKIEISIDGDEEIRLTIVDNAKIIPQVSESSITFNVVKILIEEQGGRLAYNRVGEWNHQEVVFAHKA